MLEVIYVVVKGGPGDERDTIGYYKSLRSAEKAALEEVARSTYGVWKRLPPPEDRDMSATEASWSNGSDYVDVYHCLLED